MATISPKCSIAGAIATGIMNSTACQFHSGATKLGTANHGASATGAKSTSPNGRLARYPATTPHRIGTSDRNPRASMEIATVTASAMNETVIAGPAATSCSLPLPSSPMARLTATGASTRPITMITGPVTIAGSNRVTTPTPRRRMTRLSSM